MDLVEIIMLAVRWLHILAVAALVGGSMFHLLGLRMSDGMANAGEATAGPNQAMSGRRRLAGACMALIVASGLIIGLDRLSRPEVSGIYLAVLGAKLILAGGTLSLVSRLTRRKKNAAGGHPGGQPDVRTANKILMLGAATFLVSVFLSAIFEVALRNG